MIINSEDPTYDFSDHPELKDEVFNYVHFDDEDDVLHALNHLPRLIGAYIELLEACEEAATKLLEPAPETNLEDRTDDWLADKRDSLKTKITTLEREQERYKEERKEIEHEFFRRFSERDSEGTQTSGWTLSAKTDDAYPVISDRSEFEEFILQTGKLHLMQKRLSITAIREELDLLLAEKNSWLMELDANGWDDETCKRVLRLINEAEQDLYGEAEIDEAAFQRKIELLLLTKKLQETTRTSIEEFCKVPGVDLEQKLTLYQRKR